MQLLRFSRVYLIAFLALGLIFCSYAVEFNLQSIRGSENTSIFEVNLGDIFAFEKKQFEHVFEYENTSQKPLNILSTSTSCGCSIAEVNKTKLSPGERVEIKVLVNVPNALTMKRVVCWVKTDRPESGDRSFIVTFRAVPRLWSELSELDMGTKYVRQSSILTRSFRLRKYSMSNISPDDKLIIKSTNPLIEVSYKPVETTESQESCRISEWSITVDISDRTKSSIGAKYDMLEIGVSSGEMIRIPVLWKVRSTYVLTPRIINFGTLANNSNIVTRKLLLVNEEGFINDELDIELDSFMSIENRSIEQDRRAFDVSLDPKLMDETGPRTGIIKIRFEDGSSVECHWFVNLTDPSL